MTLTDIVIDIHQRETRAAIGEALAAKLRDVAEEYGIETSPRWLLPVFLAVKHGRAISSPVFFELEESDTHSYLAEVHALLRWNYESEGEYTSISFPVLGWQIYASHEASSPITRRGGSTYEVMRLTR